MLHITTPLSCVRLSGREEAGDTGRARGLLPARQLQPSRREMLPQGPQSVRWVHPPVQHERSRGPTTGGPVGP